MNRFEQVGTGVKSFDKVLIPALRRSYQSRWDVLFFLDGESHAIQIWPTLRRSYPISTLPNALNPLTANVRIYPYLKHGLRASHREQCIGLP